MSAKPPATPPAAAVAPDEQVVRVELKAKTHNSVKTIRVRRNARPEEIIRAALAKNHLSEADVAQYDLAAESAAASKDVMTFVMRPKDIFDSPAHGRGLDDTAYKNPLFGAQDGAGDAPVGTEQVAQLLEALEAERRERLEVEERLVQLEEQMEAFQLEVKASADAQLAALRDDFKKKKNKYKIDIEKLRTQVEVQQEQIEDLQELIKLYKEGKAPPEKPKLVREPSTDESSGTQSPRSRP